MTNSNSIEINPLSLYGRRKPFIRIRIHEGEIILTKMTDHDFECEYEGEFLSKSKFSTEDEALDFLRLKAEDRSLPRLVSLGIKKRLDTRFSVKNCLDDKEPIMSDLISDLAKSELEIAELERQLKLAQNNRDRLADAVGRKFAYWAGEDPFVAQTSLGTVSIKIKVVHTACSMADNNKYEVDVNFLKTLEDVEKKRSFIHESSGGQAYKDPASKGFDTGTALL